VPDPDANFRIPARQIHISNSDGQIHTEIYGTHYIRQALRKQLEVGNGQCSIRCTLSAHENHNFLKIILELLRAYTGRFEDILSRISHEIACLWNIYTFVCMIGTTQILPNIDPSKLTGARVMKSKNDRYRKPFPVEKMLLLWIEPPTIAMVKREIRGTRFYLYCDKTASCVTSGRYILDLTVNSQIFDDVFAPDHPHDRSELRYRVHAGSSGLESIFYVGEQWHRI
jgi:hypothetical protein